MTKKIFRAILLVAASVLLANLLIVMGCLYGHFGRAQERQLKDELRLAAYAVEESGQAYLEALAAPDYRYSWTPDYRLTWIGRDGAVLFDTVEPAQGMENHGDRAEVREAFTAGESSTVRYSSTLTERTLYCARALRDGTVLRISINQATIPVLVLAMLQPILLVGVLAVILSAVLAHLMAKKIVRPLNELDLEHPLENNAYEELTPLLRRIQQQRQQLAADTAEQAAAERSRREFTANVSHELKTPLQSILGSAELLRDGMVKQEDIPQFSNRIYGETRRLVALVEDIIHLSQLDEGAAVEWESVDLLELAKSAALLLEDSAEKKHVTLSVTGESVRVYGVRSFLQEMLNNLCDNAVKYNVENGKVELTVSHTDQGAVVSIRDTGIGIPPEYHARIFERFFRVDKSRSKASGGTGLGLSIVKHAALLHHAKLEVDSAVGQGTTMTVRFPA